MRLNRDGAKPRKSDQDLMKLLNEAKAKREEEAKKKKKGRSHQNPRTLKTKI
jgi:hypothetical protein